MTNWNNKCQAFPRPKVKYTMKQAAAEARNVNAQRPQGYVSVFKCNVCKCYHVGTPPSREPIKDVQEVAENTES